jgi:hypothetical protein
MTIATFNNRTVIVRRLKTSVGSRKSYTATATADTNIQNIENEESFTKEGIGRKAYKAYFEVDQDIQVNDKLVDQNTGDEYRVMAVEKMGDGLGLSVGHLEVILHKFTD